MMLMYYLPKSSCCSLVNFLASSYMYSMVSVSYMDLFEKQDSEFIFEDAELCCRGGKQQVSDLWVRIVIVKFSHVKRL